MWLPRCAELDVHVLASDGADGINMMIHDTNCIFVRCGSFLHAFLSSLLNRLPAWFCDEFGRGCGYC